MNIDNVPQFIFFAMFAIIAGYCVVRVVKYGGIRAAMFGARIRDTTGEVSEAGRRFMTTTIKVHILEDGAPGRDVGLELVAKGVGSYRMRPLSLSVDQTKRLIECLQSAVNGRVSSHE